jgi:hypothetical protein
VRGGNQPFQRIFTADEAKEATVFRPDVLAESLRVFGAELLSDVYIGWASGFLDAERRKLQDLLADAERSEADGGSGSAIREWKKATGRTIHLIHPREAADRLAEVLEKDGALWID